MHRVAVSALFHHEGGASAQTPGRLLLFDVITSNRHGMVAWTYFQSVFARRGPSIGLTDS